MLTNFRIHLQTLAIAGVGVALFRAASLPLPWLLGPLFGCLIAALAGVSLATQKTLGDGMRTVLGVAVGASITPALIGRLPEMALSVALVPVFVLSIGAVGYPYFRRIWGFDPATSYYAAMPGGLQDMLIFGEEAGGNPRILSLIHATRVLIIVSALPLVLTYGFGMNLDHPPGQPASQVPLRELVVMLITAVAGWRIALWTGLFGASILGPLILAAIASLAGFLHTRPPAEVILAAQFFIGLSVGAKYAGITLGEMRRVVTAAVGYTFLILILGAAFAGIATALQLAHPTEATLAFSPGGQAEMAVLAIVAGADIAFVVTHHVVRIVVVIIGAPLVRRFLR